MIVNIQIQTNLGNIDVELFPLRAPNTVLNFLRYLEVGAYDGVIFHRCIKNFMIQCGTVNPDLTERPVFEPVASESPNGLSNTRYTLAMARTNDPHSAAGQWFINLNDNTFLNYANSDNYGYTVFGRVVGGVDVVEAIGSIPIRPRGQFPEMPIVDIQIKTITVNTLPS